MPKSWNFNTQYDDWCECENAVSYDHENGQEIPEHDLRFVQRADLSKAVNADDKSGQVLFEGLPESGASSNGSMSGKGACRSQQPGVHRGQLLGAREGLPDGEDAGTPPSTKERLRAGAYSSSRSDIGPEVGTGRGSAPYQSGSVGQQAGESASVQGSHGALDDGTLHGLGRCTRCGKLRQEFKAFGTGLKPSCEPVCVARKPLIGTVAQNVLAHGCGGLNIDGCRVGTDGATTRSHQAEYADSGWRTGHEIINLNLGRWPANVVHDGSDDACAGMGESSRYFYAAKADQAERDKGIGSTPVMRNDGRTTEIDNPYQRGKVLRNHHATVKPVDLMRWLVRLVCPPGGVCLDPFMGSGTTGVACRLEGFGFIGIDRESEYIELARQRIDAETPSLFTEAS